jgi:hypothetical protein
LNTSCSFTYLALATISHLTPFPEEKPVAQGGLVTCGSPSCEAVMLGLGRKLGLSGSRGQAFTFLPGDPSLLCYRVGCVFGKHHYAEWQIFKILNKVKKIIPHFLKVNSIKLSHSF